jgi:hypothetical protein
LLAALKKPPSGSAPLLPVLPPPPLALLPPLAPPLEPLLLEPPLLPLPEDVEPPSGTGALVQPPCEQS